MSDKAPLEVQKSLEIVDGDLELLEELLGYFAENSEEQLRKISEFFKQGDSENVRFYAHQLKSACKSLAAEDAAAVAYTIEKNGAEGDLSGLPPLMDELVREVERVGAYYRTGRWKRDFDPPGKSNELSKEET